MKIQLMLFLMFWFNNMFAPEVSSPQRHKLNYEHSIVIQEETAKEVSNDSIDISTLKHYKMSKMFTKTERQKVRGIAKDLGIKPKWLYKIFYIESRGKTTSVNYQRGDSKDPIERIKLGRAVGLIQFIPSTAIGLGTTTEKLYYMSVTEQLDYVHEYYKRALKNKKVIKESTLYLATFAPATIGLPDSTVIRTKTKCAYTVYKQNKGLDINNDKVITVGDIHLFIALL